MATAMCHLSEEQFRCSICLDVFTEPVTTPCGHNFCKNCINQHWACVVLYNCPICKQTFTLRPELKVNILISEMIQQFKSRTSVQLAAAPGEVSCDLCPEPRLKALKSCLVCLSAYCELHIQPHLNVPGLNQHQLTEPTKDLSERVCEEHDKPLELYCSLDQCFVCVLCTYCTHKGHKVVPLKFSCEEQLRGITGSIAEVITDREEKLQLVRRSVAASNNEAGIELTHGVNVLTALKGSVAISLDKLVQDINMSMTVTEMVATEVITEMEQEISELKKKRSDLEQLAQTDYFHALKRMTEFRSAPKTDCEDVHIYQSTYNGTVVRALSELEQQFLKKTRSLVEEDLERVRVFMRIVQLDRDTAHPQLSVSDDGTEVQHCPEENSVQDRPESFDHGLYVLGTEGFRGSVYFEVLVSQKSEWTVGVAKESVNRKGEITLNPENGFWTLSFRNNKYYASAEHEVCLQTRVMPATVGVFVDHDEGIVSFYDVGARYMIYSYTDCYFVHELFPFFSPGQYCRLGNPLPLTMSTSVCEDSES